MSAEESLCPLCDQPLAKPREDIGRDSGIWHRYNCAIHGLFDFEVFCCQDARIWSREKRALLSHILWKRWGHLKQGVDRKGCELSGPDAERLVKSETLPNPAQMADNFVMLLGERLGSDFGGLVSWSLGELRVQIGAVSDESAKYVVEELDGALVQIPMKPGDIVEARLTFKGWERYEDLKRGAADSKRAFMAMKYGDDLLNRMYQECFKLAARDAGFSLERLDEHASAGLIDSRMMEMIRRSRFVVADLTCDNSGAYWEAGYAEGLGKKVIYTVSKAWLAKETERKVHFDVDHFERIEWEEGKEDEAKDKLATRIRNTFDLDAKVVEQ